MLVKEEKVWCPLCGKETGIKKHETEKEVDENAKLYGPICDVCKEIMAEGVTLRCLGEVGEVEKDGVIQKVPCCTVTVVTKEVLEKNGFVEGVDFELGGFMDVKGCPVCSADKSFHFGK